MPCSVYTAMFVLSTHIFGYESLFVFVSVRGVSGVLFLFFVDFLVFEVTFLCGLPHGCPIGNLFSLIIFISTIIITVARLASKRKHGGRKLREWVAGGGGRGQRGGVWRGGGFSCSIQVVGDRMDESLIEPCRSVLTYRYVRYQTH